MPQKTAYGWVMDNLYRVLGAATVAYVGVGWAFKDTIGQQAFDIGMGIAATCFVLLAVAAVTTTLLQRGETA